MLPDPFDVLEATLAPAARVVPLEDVRVVRTAGRADHAPGNAVHHLQSLAADELPAAVADLDRRFPNGRARLVMPHAPELVAVDRGPLVATTLQVLRHGVEPAPGGHADVQLVSPTDDRDWHGVTVLQRHAVAPGEDRARGRQDERLRWWVEGLRDLVRTGRARVLRAVRFGTPVGVAVLHWAPGVVVGDEHAGLAVVAGVVVHPAHRGIGIARTLSEALVERHLGDFPHASVTAVAEHVGAARAAHVPEGWQHHATLLALTRRDGPAEA